MEGSAAKSGKKKSDVVVAQARRLSIIDVSSEDDSLLGLAPGFIQDDASSGSLSPSLNFERRNGYWF